MRAIELERYLHNHIPLSRAMQVSVQVLEDELVVLGAPLAPNINHRETVFGGSAAALATLSCWCLLHARLHGEGTSSRLVIQRNSMEFLRPIDGDFTARAALEQPERWAQFSRMLERKGKARIALSSTLQQGGETVGEFSGEFVALPAEG